MDNVFDWDDFEEADKKLLQSRKRVIKHDVEAFFGKLPVKKQAEEGLVDQKDKYLCGVDDCTTYHENLARH